MYRLLSLVLLTACGSGAAPFQTVPHDPNTETVALTMQTSLGTVHVEVWTEEAPLTAANFLDYVDDGFYDGTDGAGETQFHRVIAGFMIQGGGLTADDLEKPTGAPIHNEARDSALGNVRGTLAMARTADPDSATAQFFINLVDNGFLDPEGMSGNEAGYAVFGQVLDGMDAVDAIAEVATDEADRPEETVLIEALTRD